MRLSTLLTFLSALILSVSAGLVPRQDQKHAGESDVSEVIRSRQVTRAKLMEAARRSTVNLVARSHPSPALCSPGKVKTALVCPGDCAQGGVLTSGCASSSHALECTYSVPVAHKPHKSVLLDCDYDAHGILVGGDASKCPAFATRVAKTCYGMCGGY